MSLKGHYYKVSYCGRDSRFRLFPAQIRMYAANASIPTSGIWRIHSYIISAPDELREPLRNMTRMQLIRTPGSWKPSASEYRNVTNVYRIALKSLA